MSRDTEVMFGSAESEWAKLGRECMGDAGGELGGELVGVDMSNTEEMGDGLREEEDDEGAESEYMASGGTRGQSTL